jgi:hypothetical protein
MSRWCFPGHTANAHLASWGSKPRSTVRTTVRHCGPHAEGRPGARRCTVNVVPTYYRPQLFRANADKTSGNENLIIFIGFGLRFRCHARLAGRCDGFISALLFAGHAVIRVLDLVLLHRAVWPCGHVIRSRRASTCAPQQKTLPDPDLLPARREALRGEEAASFHASLERLRKRLQVVLKPDALVVA